MTKIKVKDLKPDSMVIALEAFDPEGSKVKVGDLGVVFHPYNYYKDKCGPMVRWFSGGMNNVYEGIVEIVNASNC